MLELMSRNWWMLLIRGIAAVLFGIAVIFYPGLSLAILVAALAAYLFVDGIFALISAIQHRDQEGWWAVALEGILGILAGIAVFLFPIAATFTFLYIVVFWAIATGVLEIIAAIQLRKQIENEWWMILSGAISIIFGIVLLLNPGEGILTLLWLFGGLAIAFGVMLVILAFRVRGMGSTSTPARA
jgi:uncharacterized membrane protein HdeD (DUF308 family)